MALYKIKNLSIENCLILAPMEAVTDISFRGICKRMGADIVYSEFVASEALIRESEKSYRKLRISEDERPIALQIFGGDISNMVESAKICEGLGADFVDINYGCWVSKVVKHQAGAALLKNPEKMAEMTNALVNAINIPVTVKTRIGWDKNSIIIEEVAKMQEQAGAAAIAIHGRTREMGMKGTADWSWVKRVKEAVDKIPVILNGDVDTPAKAVQAFNETNCDAVMIGRGAIGNPFIFKMTKEYLRSGIEPPLPNADEKINICIEHLKAEIQDKGLPRGLIEFRKHYSGYMKGMYNSSNLRQKLVLMNDLNEITDSLRDFIEYSNKYEQEKYERTI